MTEQRAEGPSGVRGEDVDVVDGIGVVEGVKGVPGANLLVVEDFAAMSALLVRVLTGEGHRVTAVRTAPAVEAACALEDFDLIVTDVHIPGGNGIEVARKVAGVRPGTRVLFLSGDAEGDLDLRVPGGQTDFLQKPFDVDELVERVRRLLGTHPAQAEASSRAG